MPEFALDSAARRRPRSVRGYLALIAAVIITAMLASNVNDSAHAAETSPTVTWTRTVTNVAGRDLCKYNATVTTTPGLASQGMVQAGALFLDVDFERPADGMMVLHSKVFVCAAGAAGADAAPSPGPAGSPTPDPAGNPTPDPAGNPTPGPAESPAPANDSATNLEPAGWNQPATRADVKVTPVSFADVRIEAAGGSLAKWIIGSVVGAVVAAIIAIFGAMAIIAAAAAVGVAITAEVAALAAACLAGATGGAIGEIIKGDPAPKIATSAIVGCAGGTFISKFKSLLQAKSVIGQAAANVAGNGEGATRSATTSVTRAAISQLAELTPEANSVVGSTESLVSSVRSELRRSVSY